MDWASFWFLVTALPFCLWAGYADLSTMTIPNRLSVWMVAAFLVPGLIFLGAEGLLWHLGAAAVVLVLLFFANAARLMGGGDAKFGAAMAPYVFADDLDVFFLTLGIFLFAALLSHRIAARIAALRSLAPDWVSWGTGRNFPMGYAMAGALIWYLAGRAF